MSSSPFEWLCEQLETRSSLKRIEARGTVRLTLKAAGFEPKSVSAPELRVVVRKLLPAELRKRRIDDADGLCDALAAEMPVAGYTDAPEQRESAGSIFGRLGRMRRSG